jgi:gliding motility-associated-like protein
MKGLNAVIFFLLFTSYCSFAQEICDNGKDDDANGLTDLQDPDCQCHFEVDNNLLQNGSFESYNNCPSNYSYESDYNIANFWQYGTYTGTNLADYYHNLKCSRDSAQVMILIPPALPLPDGNAFMSIRQYVFRKPFMDEKDIAKVYISQCLQAPLKPGEEYTLSFSAGRFQSSDDREFKFKSFPFSVAIFGHTDCNAVPFGPEGAISNGCPANFSGWVLLGKTNVVSKGNWVQNKISFTVPFDINVIEIGPDCSLFDPAKDLADSTTFLDDYVYYLDDLHLLPTKDFHFPHIQNQNGNPCSEDSVLNAPVVSNAAYQWYKDSIAIVGATQMDYHLPKNNSSGYYNVRINTGETCVISEPFAVGLNPLSSIKIPADTALCDADTLTLAPQLEGISYMVNGIRNSMVHISKEGTYTIVASDENGCSKTFTTNVHSQNCKIFMPNAFTPNGDGKNDVFKIPVQSQIILKEFSIYNRWGNKIFTTTDRNIGWDGSFKGAESSPDIYLYLIKGVSNNKNVRLKGIVTLIR